MAKLSVGDVMNCCIKRITYYGIFVEIISLSTDYSDSIFDLNIPMKAEGVPTLIHPTQVSWNDTLDHAPYFRVDCGGKSSPVGFFT
ncbi:unnamed protein product [Camellia sinensis]